jgi:hypothetical protein
MTFNAEIGQQKGDLLIVRKTPAIPVKKPNISSKEGIKKHIPR